MVPVKGSSPYMPQYRLYVLTYLWGMGILFGKLPELYWRFSINSRSFVVCAYFRKVQFYSWLFLISLLCMFYHLCKKLDFLFGVHLHVRKFEKLTLILIIFHCVFWLYLFWFIFNKWFYCVFQCILLVLYWYFYFPPSFIAFILWNILNPNFWSTSFFRSVFNF